MTVYLSILEWIEKILKFDQTEHLRGGYLELK